jgi:hypothetical protein
MNKTWLIFLFFFAAYFSFAQNENELYVSGQASLWANITENKSFQIGSRYLPQLNYKIQRSRKLIDFEASVNLNGFVQYQHPDSIFTDGRIKAYRLWARYSTEQLEVRAGMQKINFGSASMLRPLMWFDQIDPRDPLQLTDGVWGLLGRYYFLNNANAWLWVLLPENKSKTWELYPSYTKLPEIGGRLQYPLGGGELAFSFHQRWANISSLQPIGNDRFSVSEQRYGLDGKWDLKVGLWFEATLTHIDHSMDSLTNQQMISVGSDYTFGIGNGLHLTLEQLFASYSKKVFRYSDSPLGFTALSASYPISLFDQVSVILYRDWLFKTTYSFVSFQHQFNKITLHAMGWWNPSTYRIPSQKQEGNTFSGKGFQLMLVYNHSKQ